MGLHQSPASWAAALDADAILAAATRVLADCGLATRLPPAIAAPAANAGLVVNADRLLFPPAAVSALLTSAPAQFRHLCATGTHDLAVGAGRTLLGPSLSARWMWSGRAERSVLGPAEVCEACDIAAALPGLAYGAAGLAATAAAPGEAARVELLAAAGRPIIAPVGAALSTTACLSAAFLAGEPPASTGPACRLLAVLPLDEALALAPDRLDDLIALSAAGAGVVVAPNLLIGATTPPSATGALVRLAAETIAVATLAQVLRPGLPVVMGVTVAEISMRNGMPLGPTAEALKVTAGARTLSRRLGLPSFALGPATAAKGLDAQAGAETAAWLSAALDHDAVLGLGGLELDDGLSLEKLVLDADLAAALAAPREAGEVADAEAAALALLAAGPGGLHIGAPETRAAARRRHRPLLADDWVTESWRAAGSPDLPERAQVVLAEMLMARSSLHADPPSFGASSLHPAPRRTMTDIAASAYSRAMRDAFGFKE